ncbi:TadE/TadG family type IV pilus assembly protein [Salipiger sp.]|uniref:TadE/TadG family type IV pilus assembly protein n=1 Tax=Salipiger sp. TaxID=2078585 RepID=UPI003513EDF5
MSQSKLRDRAARAWRDEAGSATVEFAILFPVFMAILTGMAWLALYLLTIANVQQLTHEVARQSLQHHGGALSRAELCATIEQSLVADLTETFVMISPERLGSVRCSAGTRAGWSEITLTYDASFMGFNSVFRRLNDGSDQITAKAIVRGG